MTTESDFVNQLAILPATLGPAPGSLFLPIGHQQMADQILTDQIVHRQLNDDGTFLDNGWIRSSSRHTQHPPYGSVLTQDIDFSEIKKGVEQGYETARLIAIGLLGSLKAEIRDLDRVKRIVKLLGLVNCTAEFTDQPKVINGASDFLVEVFGEKGKHARSAVGTNALPFNIAVEIEMIVEIEG